MPCALFLPANQERFYNKGVEFSPSVYVPDMEDSVPLGEKDKARAMCKEKIKFLHARNPKVKIVPRPNELVLPLSSNRRRAPPSTRTSTGS